MTTSLALAGAAADLVTRSRLGEQNATAMIQEIAKAAARGVERAKQAAAALHEYIRSHPAQPVRQTVAIGAEDQRTLAVLREVPSEAGPLLPALRDGLALRAAVIVLANGAPITEETLRAAHASYQEPGATAFVQGANLAPDPSKGSAPEYRAGRVLALAFRLQRVRLPDSRLADFDSSVAWELGE